MIKILVVDDDKDILQWLKVGMSRNKDFHVLTAETSKAGHVMAEKERPDLAVIDVGLPDGDGIDLCWKIKVSQTTKDTSVIIMTGMVKEPELKHKSLVFLADDFVTKPFSYDLLEAKIHKLLKK